MMPLLEECFFQLLDALAQRVHHGGFLLQATDDAPLQFDLAFKIDHAAEAMPLGAFPCLLHVLGQ